MKKKQRKVKSATKAAPRKRAPQARPQAAQKGAPAKSREFPMVVHVAKAGDSIPVTVSDQAHLDRLTNEHGAASVKVPE